MFKKKWLSQEAEVDQNRGTGSEEANIKESKLSINSPMGKGLLGKKVGEIALIATPSGPIELEVLEIGLNL